MFKFFTRSNGLVKAAAEQKKLIRHPPLDCPAPFDRAVINLLSKRSQPGMRLIDYQLTERSLWMSEDLELLAMTTLLLEIIEWLSAEEDPQPEVYELLTAYLRAVAKSPVPGNMVLHTAMKIFGIMGYEPGFEYCRKCQKPPGKRNYFHVSSGGFLHERCAGRKTGGLIVSPGTLRFMNRLNSIDIGSINRIKGDLLIGRESFAMLGAFVNYLCQKKLNSQIFLTKLSSGGENAAGMITGA